MSAVIVLLLSILVFNSKAANIQAIPYMKDETSEYETLCAAQIFTMDFTSLRIREIKENFLSSILISCLDFQNTEITDLHHNAFDNLPDLKYLQMSSNSFRLADIFYNRFDNLEVLILDAANHNDFHSSFVKVGVKSIYQKLRRLFLRNNQIREIQAASNYTFPSLTHLYLSGNELQVDNFDWLPETLEYLDLTGHRLESLTLKNLRNLKLLFVDAASTKSLRNIYFENLDSLQYLSAPSNIIGELSSSNFVNTTSLLYLDLSDNDIHYVDGGTFDSMRDLQFLNLSSNKIEVVQHGLFDKLANLETLVLEKNIIINFPMISKETNLKLLLLNCNKIKSIIGGTFTKMTHLESLFLHDNEISYIDQEAFKGLENLRILTLSNNKLSQLPLHWILPMMSLEELDLSGNNLIKFGNLALSESLTLKNIYLSKQLLYIETQSLFNLPNNATINLVEDFKFVDKCEKDESKYKPHRYG